MTENSSLIKPLKKPLIRLNPTIIIIAISKRFMAIDCHFNG
jgi:hypothetical protein